MSGGLVTTEPVTTLRGRLSGRGDRRVAVFRFVARFGTLMLLAAMIAYFGIRAPGNFLTWSNLLNILSSASLVAIVSEGLTVTLVVGEFDLSVGYATSFAGVVVACFMANLGVPLVPALVLVLLVGTGIGLLNGVLVTKVRINAVIATLGVGIVLTGLEFIFAPVPIVNGIPHAFSRVGLGRIFLNIPNPVWFMLGVSIALWALLNRTDLGMKMQAVGGNIEASRLAGIRVDRIKILAFAIAGACAALTGFLLSAILGSGTISAGDGYLLESFAAVFLGSATLRDGEFHVLGTIVGVLIIGVGFSGLSIINAPSSVQPIFEGASLIFAVGLATGAQRYAKS